MDKKKSPARSTPARPKKANPRDSGHQKASEPSHGQELELALVVSSRIQFDDVALISLSVKRADEPWEGRLRLEVEPKDVAYRTDTERDRLSVRATLSLDGYGELESEQGVQAVLSIEATFALLYHGEDVCLLPPENLMAFARTNALFHLWPFWRELVMNTSARMRIPPIMVPVFRL